MDFLNDLLFVGMKHSYNLIDVIQGRSCKDICTVNKGTYMPFCIPMNHANGQAYGSDSADQGEMLLANDRMGLFYDFLGSPARGVGRSCCSQLMNRREKIWNGQLMHSVVFSSAPM